MKIFLTNKQYETLLQSLAITEHLYWFTWDLVDEKYEKDFDNIDNLINYLLWFHKDFWVDKSIIEVFEGKNYFSAEYIKKILNDMEDYNELIFWESLKTKFATRSLYDRYWDRINQISSEEFVNARLEEVEKMHKEFEENGINNLVLVWNDFLLKK
jgi:hypothetical protein